MHPLPPAHQFYRKSYFSTGWEAVDLLSSNVPSSVDSLVATLRPSLRQIRGVALGMAISEGYKQPERLLKGWPEWEPIEWVADLPPRIIGTIGVWPMLPEHVDDWNMMGFIPASARFRAGCSSLAERGEATYAVAEAAPLAYANHRYRAWQAAGRAFRAEREAVRELFDPRVLTSRAQQLILVTEAASLAGKWSEPAEGADALWFAASALRSAFFLWLEDDDRAVACVRSGLGE